MKELKERKLQSHILKLAQKNIEGTEKKQEYRLPDSYGDSEQHSMASKDKRMKALYSRYEDVPNAQPETKLW